MLELLTVRQFLPVMWLLETYSVVEVRLFETTDPGSVRLSAVNHVCELPAGGSSLYLSWTGWTNSLRKRLSSALSGCSPPSIWSASLGLGSGISNLNNIADLRSALTDAQRLRAQQSPWIQTQANYTVYSAEGSRELSSKICWNHLKATWRTSTCLRPTSLNQQMKRGSPSLESTFSFTSSWEPQIQLHCCLVWKYSIVGH